MADTYKSGEEAAADREMQQALLRALAASPKTLRRDECGASRIKGKYGHIYTWGDGRSFLLYVGGSSARAWSAVKEKLSFCRVTQDGDDEGCLRLPKLPTPDEAQAIRTALGIRKRAEKSTQAIIAEQGRLALARKSKPTRRKKGVSGRKIGDRRLGGISPLPPSSVEIPAGKSSFPDTNI